MSATNPAKEAFVLEVHYRLSEIYGSGIKYFHDLDPLSELVSSLLSHRTRNSESAKTFGTVLKSYLSKTVSYGNA